jgi:hypothetical protein
MQNKFVPIFFLSYNLSAGTLSLVLKNFIFANILLKFYFASIISIRSTPLYGKGRIRMAQKHVDPVPDPQHWVPVAVKTMYIPESVSKSACRSVLYPIFIHSANLVDEKSSGV